MRYALLISYDGAAYCGWQRQSNAVSVQQCVEEAIYAAFGVKCAVVASGRTDSGVHAEGQVCHADMDVTIPAERIADALNVVLPEDISVLCSAKAPDGFDANRSAKKKTYVYNFYTAHRRQPLKDRYSVWVKGRLDLKKMSKASELFTGVHDFKAYCSSGSAVKTTVREIYRIKINCVKRGNCEDYSVEVCGNGFLYNMVRTLAGTLIYCAAGRISADDVKKSIDLGDRSLVGKTMPPQGLVLKEVDYGVDLFGKI